MPRLSIIIPVYNAENHIRKCLDSIISQGFFDYECIMVNDGSSDNSEAICQEYADINSRFVLVSKPNGGASSARNAGIEEAKGEYITFVDCDDFIINDIYKKAFEIIDETDADVVCFDMMQKTGDTETKIEFSDSGLEKNFINYGVYMHSVCNKLFRLKTIKENGYRFDEDLHTCEDFLFVFRSMSSADKIIYMDETGYQYNINEQSLTHVIRDTEMAEDQRKAYQYLKEFCEKQDITEEYSELLKYRKLCWAILYLVLSNMYDPERYRKIAGEDEYWVYGKKSLRMISYFASRGFDLPAGIYVSLKKLLKRR